MTNIRKLWFIGALATLAACDPYTKENKGPLEVLSAFAVSGDSSDFATGLFEATGATSPFTIGEIDSGNTVFFVKANKLLDGSKIQADPLSCKPAPEVALTVNAVADPPGWFACYVPTTSTPSEGASLVIYQGKDISVTKGYFDSAKLVHGFYVITATLTDKQGHQQPVTINAAVRTDAFVESVTPDSAVVTWKVGGTGATSYTVERAPNTLNAKNKDVPGDFAAIAGGSDLAPTVESAPDSGLTAETKYWYRVVVSNGTDTATSAPIKILTAVAPGAPTVTAVAATAAAAAHIEVTWTEVASKVSTYFVERSTTPGDPASWEELGTKDASASATPTTLTFTDEGTTDVPLVAGTTYHYRIKAGGDGWATVPGPEGSAVAQ